MLANFIAIFSLDKLLSTQHSFFTVTELVFSITKKKNLEMVLNEVDCLVKDDQTDGV